MTLTISTSSMYLNDTTGNLDNDGQIKIPDNFKLVIAGRWFSHVNENHALGKVAFTISTFLTTTFNKQVKELEVYYDLPDGNAGTLRLSKSEPIYFYAPKNLILKLREILKHSDPENFFPLTSTFVTKIIKIKNKVKSIQKVIETTRNSTPRSSLSTTENTSSLSNDSSLKKIHPRSFTESFIDILEGEWQQYQSTAYLPIRSVEILFLWQKFNNKITDLAKKNPQFLGITLIKENHFFKMECSTLEKLKQLVSQRKRFLFSLANLPPQEIEKIKCPISDSDLTKSLIIKKLNSSQWKYLDLKTIFCDFRFDYKGDATKYLNILNDILPNFRLNHQCVQVEPDSINRLIMSVEYFNELMRLNFIDRNVQIEHLEGDENFHVQESLGNPTEFYVEINHYPFENQLYAKQTANHFSNAHWIPYQGDSQFYFPTNDMDMTSEGVNQNSWNYHGMYQEDFQSQN